jgi:general L-amino acid transport system substrate-binding protein
MFKYLKQLTSLVAMVAVLFAFTTETMAAKKSNHNLSLRTNSLHY